MVARMTRIVDFICCVDVSQSCRLGRDRHKVRTDEEKERKPDKIETSREKETIDQRPGKQEQVSDISVERAS